MGFFFSLSLLLYVWLSLNAEVGPYSFLLDEFPGHIYPHAGQMGQAADLCGWENFLSIRMTLPETFAMDSKQRCDVLQETSTC